MTFMLASGRVAKTTAKIERLPIRISSRSASAARGAEKYNKNRICHAPGRLGGLAPDLRVHDPAITEAFSSVVHAARWYRTVCRSSMS